MTPASAIVPTLIEAAIVSNHQMIRFIRIKNDGVIVDMDLPRHALECLPSIVRHVDSHIDRVKALGMMRIGIQLAVILWIDDFVIALANPGGAAVGRSEEPAVVSNRCNERV